MEDEAGEASGASTPSSQTPPPRRNNADASGGPQAYSDGDLPTPRPPQQRRSTSSGMTSTSTIHSLPTPTEFSPPAQRFNPSSNTPGKLTSLRASARYSRARRISVGENNTSVLFRRESDANIMSSARSHDINNDDISAKSGEDMYEVIDLRPTAPPLELSNSFTSLASHLTVDSGLREVLQMSITDDLEGIQRNDLPSHWDVLPPSHWNLAGSEKSPLKNPTDSVEMTRGTMTRRDSMRRDTACSTDGHSDAWSGASSDHSGSSSKSGSSSSSTDTVFDKKWKRKLYIGLVFKSTAIFAVVMVATSAVLFILSDQVQESILSSMAHSKFFVNLFGLADGVEMRQSGRMMVQFPESKRDGISISWVDHCRQAGILKH